MMKMTMMMVVTIFVVVITMGILMMTMTMIIKMTIIIIMTARSCVEVARTQFAGSRVITDTSTTAQRRCVSAS